MAVAASDPLRNLNIRLPSDIGATRSRDARAISHYTQASQPAARDATEEKVRSVDRGPLYTSEVPQHDDTKGPNLNADMVSKKTRSLKSRHLLLFYMCFHIVSGWKLK